MTVRTTAASCLLASCILHCGQDGGAPTGPGSGATSPTSTSGATGGSGGADSGGPTSTGSASSTTGSPSAGVGGDPTGGAGSGGAGGSSGGANRDAGGAADGAWGDSTSFPRIAPQYHGTFTAPPSLIDTDQTTNAPLLGNGDVGVAILNNVDTMTFILHKNEFRSLAEA